MIERTEVAYQLAVAEERLSEAIAIIDHLNLPFIATLIDNPRARIAELRRSPDKRRPANLAL